MRDSEWSEVTFIRCQNRKTTGSGRGGNGDVLEAGIVCASAIENGAGVAGFLDAEGQDAPSIEMLDGGKPAAQAIRFGRGADTLGAGNPSLDLGDGYGRDVKLIAVLAHPGSKRLWADRVLRWCIC